MTLKNTAQERTLFGPLGLHLSLNCASGLKYIELLFSDNFAAQIEKIKKSKEIQKKKNWKKKGKIVRSEPFVIGKSANIIFKSSSTVAPLHSTWLRTKELHWMSTNGTSY